MKLENKVHLLLEQDMSRYESLSAKTIKKIEKIQKSLNNLNEKLFFKDVTENIKVGDVFVVQTHPDIYFYGKVLSKELGIYDEVNKISPDYVLLFYKQYCDSIIMPEKDLLLSNLMLRPQLQIKHIFSSGFAKVIGNIPLTEEEKNIDLGFFHGIRNMVIEYEQDELDEVINNNLTQKKMNDFLESKKTIIETKKYYDVKGNELNKEPSYCGYLKTEGLGIITKILEELVIDDSILGNKENVFNDKPIRMLQADNTDGSVEIIESIVKDMMEFQQDCGEYNGAIKEAIDLFSKLSYMFYKKAYESKDEKDYLKCVKEYVLGINVINEYTDYSLIETVERELICNFIDEVSQAKELYYNYDITENYREW